jgi:hypothetical protein
MEEQPSALKRIEFGILELVVGALMVIGIIGYFGHVSADLDWLDHGISFVLFTYLFYKLNISSILFGHSRKGLDFLIVVSFFLIFFKDIIRYTLATPNEFTFLTFVSSLQQVFSAHIVEITNATIYAGFAGLLLVSILFAFSSPIAHPSLGYVLFPQENERKFVNVLLCFVLLIAFYYFVYSMVLEWLEFVLDDPIIFTGIIFYVHSLTSRKEQFHPESFVFKIGDFSEGLYVRFISLFHYKKTLPLAISGLLILHALADIGVFAYAFSFGKENLYLESLEGDYKSWPALFSIDSEGQPLGLKLSLAVAYILNALSLFVFLAIPIVAWWRIFNQKELHLRQGVLFVIYASGAMFLLLPAYDIGPLSEEMDIVGVDIYAFSVMDSTSALEGLMPDRAGLVVSVAVLSVLVGILAMALGFNASMRKELYAFSIACSFFFFGVYLYEYMGSVLLYLGNGIGILMSNAQWILAAIFIILFILSILFYIVGYLLFLYEIIMEYHNQKWSEPVDEELVKVIDFMRRTEQRLEHVGRKAAPATMAGQLPPRR